MRFQGQAVLLSDSTTVTIVMSEIMTGNALGGSVFSLSIAAMSLEQ